MPIEEPPKWEETSDAPSWENTLDPSVEQQKDPTVPARSGEELGIKRFYAQGANPLIQSDGKAEPLSLMAPLIQLPRVTAQQLSDAMDVIGAAGFATSGKLTPERARIAQEIKESPSKPPNQAEQVAAGVVNVAKSVPEAFTSPVGAATLMMGGAPLWAQRLVAAGFTADMVRHAPESWRRVGEVWDTGTPQERTEALGDALVNSAFVVGAGKHAVTPAKVQKARLLARQISESTLKEPTKVEQAAPAAERAPRWEETAPERVATDPTARPEAVKAEAPKWEETAPSPDVKFAKREDGSLKTKAEYTSEEWRDYTGSVIDTKLGKAEPAIDIPAAAAEPAKAEATITGANERTGSGMPAEPAGPGRAGPQRSQPTIDRPWDIIDDLEANLGGTIHLQSAKDLNPDFRPVGAARKLFGQKGSVGIDRARQAVEAATGKTFVTDDAFLTALNGAAEARKQSRVQGAQEKRLLVREEKQTVEFEKAQESAPPKEPQTIDGSTLIEGDEFTLKGEKVRVKEVQFDENGEAISVVLEDGARFGTQRVSPERPLNIDKGSLKMTERSTEFLPAEEKAEAFSLNQPEGVAEQQARFEREAAARTQQDQRAKLEEEAARPLVGSRGDIGQRDLLGGGDLFADPSGPARPRGTSGMGDPMGAPAAPAIPAPAPAPGATMLFSGRIPVTMNRTGPGSVAIPQIMDSLLKVQRVAGSASGNIRTGRFTQKARGIFKPHEEIIRLDSADNIPTAVHEVGHALQKQVYGTAKASGLKSLPADVRRELVGMGKALYGSRKPAAGYSGEGFAEFMRYYLTTNDAAKVAPRTLAFFEKSVLPLHPEIARSLEQSRQLIETWRNQGAEERARRQVVREPGAMARVAKALGQFVSYQSQLESFAPIEAVSKAARSKLGSLPAAQDPFKLASWKRGSAGATVETMATRHMVDVWGNPSGPSLAEALAPVKGQRNEFLLYLFARRAVERWGKNINPGITLPDAQHIKALYDKPEFQIAAQKYYDWWDGVLNYVVQADPTMADVVGKIKNGSSDYAPLARMIDPLKAKKSASQAQGNPLMRMFGSGLPVKDIFDQTFINAARLINRANRGLVTNAIVKMANVEGLGHIIEEVPLSKVRERVNIEKVRQQLEDMGVDTSSVAPDEVLTYYTPADMPKGSDPIIRYKSASGTDHWFQVDPRLYEALEGLQTFSLKDSFPGVPGLGTALDLVLGAPARLFKLGTTGLRPAFSLFTNPARDLQTMLAQTHAGNPAAVAAAYPRALAGVIREGITGKAGPYVQAFYDLGAHMGQPLGLDISHTRRVSNELFHGRFMRVALNPIDHLRQAFSLTEAAPRVAELKAIADEVGWKPGTKMSPNQAVEMAMAAKRVTIDFSAAGEASRVLNSAIPFYNPAVQGLRGFGRAFKEHPLRATLMGLSLFMTPALLNWWKNKDEEWYRALPWRERYLYTNIDDGKNVWRIPRPFEWGMAFMALPEAALDAWYMQDPEAVKQALAATFDTMNPMDYPVALKAAKEQWRNRVDFFDRPIVPRGEEDLPAAMQVGPYTTKLATSLNKIFPDVSPRRVDAFIRAYLGGAGPDALDLIGLGSPKSQRERERSDMPVLGAAWRRGGHFNAQNQHVTDFYDSYLPVRAQMEGFNRQVSRTGVQGGPAPEPPSATIQAQAMAGEIYSQYVRLCTQLANASTNTAQRAELYREAGRWAQQGLEAMKARGKQYNPARN